MSHRPCLSHTVPPEYAGRRGDYVDLIVREIVPSALEQGHAQAREGVEAMASAGVCAVLLPGAAHTLRATRGPPVGALRRAGVTMALATDANPGSSPITHVGLILNLACIQFGLTPEEALTGFRSAAARVLGLEADRARSRSASARTSPSGTWMTCCGSATTWGRARCGSTSRTVWSRSGTTSFSLEVYRHRSLYGVWTMTGVHASANRSAAE